MLKEIDKYEFLLKIHAIVDILEELYSNFNRTISKYQKSKFQSLDASKISKKNI